MEEPPALRGGWLALAAVRFLAEIGMIAGLAYVGYQLAEGNQGIGFVLAVVAAALGAAVWGRWVAPRAVSRLEDPSRLVVELVLFGVAVIGLALLGSWVFAAVLALGYAVSAPVGRRGL